MRSPIAAAALLFDGPGADATVAPALIEADLGIVKAGAMKDGIEVESLVRDDQQLAGR